MNKDNGIMENEEVPEYEFNFLTGMEDVYGKDITKAAQQIIKVLNGLTIEQANAVLDLAKHGIKRICKINI